MKILIVNGLFLPYLNGTVVYFRNFFRELIRQGHEVTMVAGGAQEKRENYEDMDLIIFEKPKSGLPLLESKKYYSERAYEKVKKLRNESFDLIISGGDIFLPGLKRLFDKNKIIYISPGIQDIDLNSHDKETVLQRKKEMISDIEGVKIITLSKSLKDDYKKHFGRINDVYVIPPGVDINYDLKKERKNEVLFVGRISPEKNIEALISAFEKINSGKLIIVGGGSGLDELKTKISKSPRIKDIKIVGKIDNPKSYYENAKVFVLPSRHESFGLVLIEAMAAELPCIAFRSDGKDIVTASEDIIENERTGFLVKDEKEMMEKINLLLFDEKLRKKMGKAARKEVKKYSWENAVKSILKFAMV